MTSLEPAVRRAASAEPAWLGFIADTATIADAELRIDYNQGMAAHDAIRHLRDVEVFKPTFIEQPVPGHQRAALAEITRALDTPVLAARSRRSARRPAWPATAAICSRPGLPISRAPT